MHLTALLARDNEPRVLVVGHAFRPTENGSAIAMIRVLLLIVGCALLAGAAVRPASASPITYDITFAGADFTDLDLNATGTPVALGRFHITLDTSHTTNDSTAGLTVDFLTVDPFTIGSPIAYDYLADFDILILGGIADGADALLHANDFGFSLRGIAAGTPSYDELLFTDASGDVFRSFTGRVHVSQVAAATLASTPLPAGLPLFISALGGLGFVGWRRRKATRLS